MLLIILIVILAAAGGFLGELLEFALWAIVILAALGALVAFLIYRWFVGMKSRFTDRT